MPAIILSTSISAGPAWRSSNLATPRTRIPVPFRGQLAQRGFRSGAASFREPVVPVDRSAGSSLRTSFNDWYYRIHITPLRIDLGNLVTSQTRYVRVWNAYLQPLTATAVQLENAEGIDMVSPGALPLPFAALQLRQWQLSITTEGPPVIAASLTYTFSGLGSRTVTITGNRMSAWMLPPDWSEPVTETLTWLTDVQQSAAGGEARYPLRAAPRRTVEFSVLAGRRERQVLEHALQDWTARTWALPIWPDVTWLKQQLQVGALSLPVPQASLQDYRVGGLVMIWQDVTSYELGEVSAVAADQVQLVRPLGNAWAPGARILPCRTARISEAPSLDRLTDQVIRSTVRLDLVEPSDWPAQPPTQQYLGVPVLERRPDLDQPLSAAFERQLDVIDGDVGPVAVQDFSGKAWTRQAHAWQPWGRAEHAELRGLLYWLQGRAQALWLPSWADDVQLVEPALATATGIIVAWAGVARFGRAQPGRRHLRIELAGGQVLYRRLLSATEMDAQREQLQLDAPLGRAIAPADVRLISWMALVRQAADGIEIAHQTDAEGVAKAKASFIGLPAQEALL